MKELKSDIYTIAFGWLHIYLFFRLTSQAMSFARVFVGNFGETIGHILVILYAVAFFVLFRNMSLIVSHFGAETTETPSTFFVSLGRWTMYFLFLLLLLQIVPEYVLSQRNQL